MPTSSDSAASRPEPLLHATDVVTGYGGAPVVTGVSLDVAPGEIVTVVGPNGAGKSTLLKAIAGVLRVRSGRVSLGDTDVTNWQTYRLARVGVCYIPQVSEVFAELTVLENLEMGGYQEARREVKQRVNEVLEMFPALAKMRKRRADRLSGGERKMVAIGRALMSKPQLLLLDEPTAGLSSALSRHVLESQVAGLGQLGTAVLMVEQKAHSALAVSQWGYVLAAGKLQISAAASEILERPDLALVFLGQAVTTD